MAPKRPDLTRSARATLDRWTRETQRAAHAERQARADLADAHRRAIEQLIAQGLSVSHIADLLGLSRQWVARIRGTTTGSGAPR